MLLSWPKIKKLMKEAMQYTKNFLFNKTSAISLNLNCTIVLAVSGNFWINKDNEANKNPITKDDKLKYSV